MIHEIKTLIYRIDPSYVADKNSEEFDLLVNDLVQRGFEPISQATLTLSNGGSFIIQQFKK